MSDREGSADFERDRLIRETENEIEVVVVLDGSSIVFEVEDDLVNDIDQLLERLIPVSEIVLERVIETDFVERFLEREIVSEIKVEGEKVSDGLRVRDRVGESLELLIENSADWETVLVGFEEKDEVCVCSCDVESEVLQLSTLRFHGNAQMVVDCWTSGSPSSHPPEGRSMRRTFSVPPFGEPEAKLQYDPL